MFYCSLHSASFLLFEPLYRNYPSLLFSIPSLSPFFATDCSHSNKLNLLMEKKERENYVRVSHVLYPFSGLDKIDADVVAHAADRGTRVHKICEGIIQGYGEIGTDEETQGYVESFKKWWADGHAVVTMEERFWDDDLEVTGQCDLILHTDDGLAIVDLKTSYKESKTWAVQGSAYAYLAKKAGYDIKKIFFVHLNKHGKEPKIYEYPVDDSFFLAVFRSWEYFYQED